MNSLDQIRELTGEKFETNIEHKLGAVVYQYVRFSDLIRYLAEDHAVYVNDWLSKFVYICSQRQKREKTLYFFLKSEIQGDFRFWGSYKEASKFVSQIRGEAFNMKNYNLLDELYIPANVALNFVNKIINDDLIINHEGKFKAFRRVLTKRDGSVKIYRAA